MDVRLHMQSAWSASDRIRMSQLFRSLVELLLQRGNSLGTCDWAGWLADLYRWLDASLCLDDFDKALLWEDLRRIPPLLNGALIPPPGGTPAAGHWLWLTSEMRPAP